MKRSNKADSFYVLLGLGYVRKRIVGRQHLRKNAISACCQWTSPGSITNELHTHCHPSATIAALSAMLSS